MTLRKSDEKTCFRIALLLDRASISRDVIKEVEIDCFGRDKGSIKMVKLKICCSRLTLTEHHAITQM